MIELVSGAVIAGKYRLEREIGRGGMGSVWCARHLQLDTRVALKFVDPGATAADAHLRFEREAKAAAQLRSPHVVQILDHGVDGTLPYIAMELLEGEDLGERLRRVGRLSLGECAVIFGQAAKALRRAHDAGVIHRDLKPSNIFIARFDEDEIVKLLDFGVAKLRYADMDPNNPATQTGVIFGSPTYMSPEQARGNKPIDHRSDLWSLAVIVFRALTGQKPFDASSIGDLVIKLCIEPPPVPSRIAPDLPPEVDRFFERAFARDPDQRFQSAIVMAAELDAIARRVPAGAAVAPSGVPLARPSATPPSGVSAGFAVAATFPAVVEVQASAPVPPSQPTPASLSPHALAAPIVVAPGFSVPGAPPSTPGLPPGTGASPAPLAGALPVAPSLPESSGRFAVDPRLAPPSMTPSPALLAPRPVASPSPSRSPMIVVGALATGALVLLILVIAALRGGPTPSPAAPVSSSAEPSVTAAASVPLPEETAAAPSAVASSLPASPEPSALAPEGPPDPPSSSASAEPSGRVKAPGKTGRGRVPNFGY